MDIAVVKTAPRLYVTADLPGPITLTDGQTNYLRNVLRLSPGGPVTVFNGRDGEFSATIEALSKKGGTLGAQEKVRAQTPQPTLTYAFAPLKVGRLDYLVEKAAEMGAGRLQPVITGRTQMRRLNLARMEANAIEACEQCGVISVPTVAPPMAFREFVMNPGGTLIAADEGLAGADAGADPVAAIRAAQPPLTVFVGPEGGFDDAERTVLAARAVRVSLGPRVLRADTAAVALLALVEAAHPS